MADYEVSRTVGKCCVSGRSFEEGEEFYSAVLDDKDGLQRCDFSADVWDGPPEGALCHFKTVLPRKNEPKKTFVNDEVVLNFFQRLQDSEDGLKQRFRFVLSLILMRKRVLKYVRTIREAGREYWEMRLVRDKTLHRVFNPVLEEQEIEDVSLELNAILHGSVAGGDSDQTPAGQADAHEGDADAAPEPSAKDAAGNAGEEVPAP